VTTKAFDPTFAKEANKFVVDAVVAKKFVVVAAVPVAIVNVKFWSVDDACDTKPLLAKIVIEDVGVRYPFNILKSRNCEE
jgi:hypothetical protein